MTIMTIKQAFYNGYISCKTMRSIMKTLDYLSENGLELEELENTDLFEAITKPHFSEALEHNNLGGNATIREINNLKGAIA